MVVILIYFVQVFLLVFGWYGLGRMFIEGLRQDSLYTTIFSLTFRTSQVLAAVIFTVCLALYIYFLIKKPNRPFFYKEPVTEGADKTKEASASFNEIFENAKTLFEKLVVKVKDAVQKIGTSHPISDDEIEEAPEQLAEDALSEDSLENEEAVDASDESNK